MTQTIIWSLIAVAVFAAFIIRAAEKTRKAEKYFNTVKQGEKVSNTGDAGIDEIFQPVNRCENNRPSQISAKQRSAAA
ncbi:MAG: hypothetical protein J5826_08470 [Bacteroidales bacterium]|nr:hypothetical protein [Bacteroidales bacterium]